MTDMFKALVPPHSVATAVEQHIKELIRARRLVAGDRLPPERQLAERLGVNRSTLRSALQSLADQGVLTRRQGSGWDVKPREDVVAANLAVYFSLEDVRFDHLFAARRAVEPAIAASAALNRTDEQLLALRACIQVMRSTDDSETYLQADSDFHGLLAAASHNPVFALLIAPTLKLLHDVRQQLSAHAEIITASHAEHEQILDAVERGDAPAAESAMLRHIDGFVTRSGDVLKKPE